MSDDNALSRDLDAFMRADDRFVELCGDDAAERWSALGAPLARSLVERQLAAIATLGVTAEVLDALAWEIGERIVLVGEAREAARRKR